MMAAITAATNNHKVIILEKMNSLGKKLLITGKGRCNITNAADMEDFFKQIPGNQKFLFSAFNNFSNMDIINFIESNGLKTKVERGGRVFPVTDKAEDVLNVFRKKLKELNVEIKYNTKVKSIMQENGQVNGVITEENEKIYAKKVILATGGKSYPLTGSTGDGYKMAEELSHTITEIKPALVPLECKRKVIKVLPKHSRVIA